MKKKLLMFLSASFILLLTACNNNTKLYTLTSITQLFEEVELHLIPQTEDTYPTIMNVQPEVYELLDDVLYVYVFESQDELIKASKKLNVDMVISDSSYVYQLNNVLMIYIPLSPAHVNFNSQIKDIIANEKD